MAVSMHEMAKAEPDEVEQSTDKQERDDDNQG